MTSAQVVSETSAINNSFQMSPQPDDHTIRTAAKPRFQTIQYLYRGAKYKTETYA